MSFVGLVILVSCRNVEKYGAVPWRMSFDLLSLLSGRRRGGRGDARQRRWVAARSCMTSPCRTLLYALVHLTSDKDDEDGGVGRCHIYVGCQSPRVSRLPGQENQGGVGPFPAPVLCCLQS
jgi:hypothetical protein